MVVFGVRLDSLFKNRKIYGNLPNFCKSLFFEDKKKCFSSQDINAKSNINKNDNNDCYDNNISETTDKYNVKIIKKIEKSILNEDHYNKTRNIERNNNDVFVNFEKNKFIENMNNTGKDYQIFKLKLKKYRPLIKNNNISVIHKDSISLPGFINLSKSFSEKRLNNLYLNNSPFKKKLKKKDDKRYLKRWNLPKAITFDKYSGRKTGRIEGKNRFDRIEASKNYYPNYNSIYSDMHKAYVHYDKDKKIDFQKIKTVATRKIICSSQKLVSNFLNNYSVINAIKEEKKKKKEERITKMKNKFGQFYKYLNNNKDIRELGLQMFQ